MGKITNESKDPRGKSGITLNNAKDYYKARANPTPNSKNSGKAGSGKRSPKNVSKNPNSKNSGKAGSGKLNPHGSHTSANNNATLNDLKNDIKNRTNDRMGQNPFNKSDHDKDRDKDDKDRDKDDKDRDKDDKDRDKDDKDRDKDDKDRSSHKKKKSDSENSAARNVIVRRKPSNRRKKANAAALRHGAKILGKDGIKLFALKKAASFYDKYLAPLINALRNRLANIGSTLKGWFNGATKLISGGINAVMGFVGLSMAASTVSTISSLAIILMLIFTPLIFVYFYLFTLNDNSINEIINYTTCVVKKAASDDLDDSDDTGGGSSSGSSGATTLAYLKKHNISAKMYTSPMNEDTWYKTAYSISKAVHKITGLKTGLIFAQLAHECGGKWSYAAKTDNNFGGVTYTSDNKAYGGTKGSVRAEGGNYVHFKNINGYVCEYADTLMEISNPPGDKKTHIAELKKMTTTKQFNDYLYLHKYYAHEAGSKERYLNGLNNWLNEYNSYVKNGYKVPHSTGSGSAKVTAVDYESDSDSDSDNDSSTNDCKTQTSDDVGASRSAIVKEAKSWKGKFHYDAANRFFQDVKNLSDRSSIPANHTTDCSGFVWFVLTRVGLKVPEWTTADMENYAKAGKNHLKKIDKEDALPGDIVIMNVGSGLGGNGHTAILTTKWGGSYAKTNIIQMGVWPTRSISTANIQDAFKDCLDGGARVTFARVTGLKKSSSKGDDDDDSSKSKVITKLSKKENAARKWIVQHESGGNYKAKNPGNPDVYGAYQLTRDKLKKGSSFGGDGTLSKKNQDVVAYHYMKQQYGSWTNAKKHWIANKSW